MHSNPWGLDFITLSAILSGKSVIDMPRLHIRSLDQATEFALSYGFDFHDQSHVERLWYFHRRALVYMEEILAIEVASIPEVLRDRKELQDLRRLLLFSSSKDPNERELQKWSCSILRVMHVFVHTESDLFSSFSEEIQKQLLSPFQQSVYTDGASAHTYLRGKDDKGASIQLEGFEIKPFKTSTSTVTKLLAKPDAYAMNVLDRLGVRFITKSILDSFRVMQFLVDHDLISFPHIMPDQSSNTIFPVGLFFEIIEELRARNFEISDEHLENLLQERLDKQEHSFLKKANAFSGDDYRFIKFITRRLVHVKHPERKETFAFFFPFEVQVLDAKSYQKILAGPSHHQAYKQRQREAARNRILGDHS